MKPLSSIRLVSSIVAFLVLLPQIANAATEYTTFASFYHPSTNTIWVLAGAATAALIAGAVIFFTGGAASPIVLSTGTWIGGLMGYSGVAATNAGLALLGGGSIASGGFGVIGGTALLTATFSFGTGIAVDYAINNALETYDYVRFVENSKKMTTLPLPKNKSGPDSYESAIKLLNKTNNEESLSSSHNQVIIKEAIALIKSSAKDGLPEKEKSKEQSLLALLYFIINDYKTAKKHAQIAYKLARNSNKKATFPAFIIATSSLYETKPDIQTTAQFFQYSVMGEPDNPMTPLLFAIYLDRMMYRFNDGYLTSSELRKVYTFSDKLPYDERRAIIQLSIVSRNFILVKLEQQKILSLTQSNKTIKSSSKTLVNVKRSLVEYKSLLSEINTSLIQQSNLLERRLKLKPGFWDKLTGKSFQEWESQWSDAITHMKKLLSSYRVGVTELESSIRKLEHYQAELRRLQIEKEKLNSDQSKEVVSNKSWARWIYLILITGLLYGGSYLFNRYKVP